MRMTEQEVMDYAAENDVKFIRLAFVDLYGTLKNMAITPSELPRAFAGGFSFDPQLGYLTSCPTNTGTDCARR